MLPFAALAGIVGATLVSEDLTAIAVGLAVRDGSLPALPGVVACALGIFLGDVGLWAAGRFVHLTPVARLVAHCGGDRIADVGEWLDAHAGLVILGSRLVPGTRLPLYLAAGASGRAGARVLGWMLVAVSLWTPLIVFGTAVAGPALARPLQRVFTSPWAARTASGLVILLLLRLMLVAGSAPTRGTMTISLARLRHWEFWPAWVMNLPVAIWIALLGIRHRGLTVFTAANPAIPDGGVVGESKSTILALLPDAWVVPWGVIAPGALECRLEAFHRLCVEREWTLPLVVKPDVGERGTGVRWLTTEDDAPEYFARETGPVIVQVAHRGPYEAGIFYARHPDEPRGRIISLTDKRFPVVTGDGVSTLRTLIAAHPRYRLQAPVFFARHAKALDRVPAPDETVALARAGNHCQGTQFLDGRALLTPALEARIDAIARAVPGFHFGRFDVRYADRRAFMAGEGFAIVELNGVTSEATHIYDPAGSVWRAWQTLCAQWSLAFTIGAANRARGHRPAPLGRLAAAAWTFMRARRAHPVAD